MEALSMAFFTRFPVMRQCLSLAVRFGLAAACLKHSISGDFNLVSLAEVQSLVDEGRFDVRR